MWEDSYVLELKVWGYFCIEVCFSKNNFIALIIFLDSSVANKQKHVNKMSLSVSSKLSLM